MKDQVKKPYTKPAVIFVKELEALAASCGEDTNNLFLGANNCKGENECAITFS